MVKSFKADDWSLSEMAPHLYHHHCHFHHRHRCFALRLRRRLTAATCCDDLGTCCPSHPTFQLRRSCLCSYHIGCLEQPADEHRAFVDITAAVLALSQVRPSTSGAPWALGTLRDYFQTVM